MRRGYRAFTLEERQTIEEMLKNEIPHNQISIALNRNPSTVADEIKYSSLEGPYNAIKAHEEKKVRTVITLKERFLIESMLKAGSNWSQIGVALSRRPPVIMKEVERYGGIEGYSALKAQKKYESRTIASNKLKGEHAKKLRERVISLEFQVEIILDQLKELKCQKS